MDLKDYVCYKKKDKIYSLGVEINSSLANDANCLNYTKDKNSNTNQNNNPIIDYLDFKDGYEKAVAAVFSDELIA